MASSFIFEAHANELNSGDISSRSSGQFQHSDHGQIINRKTSVPKPPPIGHGQITNRKTSVPDRGVSTISSPSSGEPIMNLEKNLD